MVAKLTTPGLHEIKVFWSKDYLVIISAHDVCKKVLSSDSNYIVKVAVRP